MKKDLASHDAIRDENVASAYVENFALKVFVAADNEDRQGASTRYGLGLTFVPLCKRLTI